MFGRLHSDWQHKYLPLQSSQFCLPLITAIGLLATSTALAACPEGISDRLDYQNSQERIVLETSNGRRYACWRDTNAQSVPFQGTTYDVVIKCSKTLTIYSYLDSVEQVLIERDGSTSLYQANFLGDRYECNPQGQTMIKTWRYRNGAEVLNQTGYSYYPYKW